MLNLVKFLLLCIFLVITIQKVKCKCSIQINSISPIFKKRLGSRYVLFKPTGSYLYLENGEEVHAYCESKLMYQLSYSNDPGFPISNGVIACRDYLFIKETANSEFKRLSDSLSCEFDSESVGLYESNNTLPKCEKYSSYGIGRKMIGVQDDVLLAMCYDFDNLTLKYAKFITKQRKSTLQLIKQKHNNLVDLSVKLDNLNQYFKFVSQEEFMSELTQNSFFEMFEFKSLLENFSINDDLNKFSYLFNIIWWRQLHQHNWQYFLQALKSRTDTKDYIVSIGTFGNATIPKVTSGTCKQNENFIVDSGDSTIIAPSYIWVYVKPMEKNNETEEFVLISHNSPFAIQPSGKLFCEEDICDEVLWLRKSKFGYLRKIPTLGYTFCCRPESVAKVIDYFPWKQQQDEKNTMAQALFGGSTTTKSVYVIE